MALVRGKIQIRTIYHLHLFDFSVEIFFYLTSLESWTDFTHISVENN